MTTKFLIATLLVFSHCSGIKLSAQITFQKTYGLTGTEVANAVREIPGGGFIVAGSVLNNSSLLMNIWLVRTNSTGDTLWSRTFEGVGSNFAQDVIIAADGNFILTGAVHRYTGGMDGCALLKVDTNGNLLWQKRIAVSTGWNQANSIRETFDHGFILCGSAFVNIGSPWNDVLYVKTDSVGNVQWAKKYGVANNHDEGFDIEQTMDSGFIMVGYTTRSSGYSSSFVMKADKNGDTLWTRIYPPALFGNYGEAVEELPDGSFILCNNPGIIMINIDANGNILWSRKQQIGFATDDHISMCKTYDGGYAICGTCMIPVEEVFVVKTDSLGQAVWCKTYGGINFDEGLSIAPTADHGFVISGATRSFGSADNDMYLLKTDSVGEIICGSIGRPVSSVISTQQTGHVQLYKYTSSVTYNDSLSIGSGGSVTDVCNYLGYSTLGKEVLTLSPNPVYDQLKVRFSSTEHSAIYSADIFNLFGEKIFSSSFCGSDFTIDCNHFQNGIYFLALQMEDGKKISNKFIVVK